MYSIIPPGVFLLIYALTFFGAILASAPALAAEGSGPSPARVGSYYCLGAIFGVVVLSLVTKTIAEVLGA